MTYKLVDDCQIAGLDKIYDGVFGPDYIGTFVEVGAHDGHQHSNTFYLAEAGWTGLYIEPMEDLYNSCVGWHKDHPNVSVANVACGTGATVNFYCNKHVRNYVSGDPHQAQVLGADKFVSSIQTVLLNVMLNNYHIQRGFDLLVVDVEGMELDVLKGFNIRLYRPRLCIVETHEHHPVRELSNHAHEISAYFGRASYVKIYSDTINSIFVRGEI